jgi:hypothetical protein
MLTLIRLPKRDTMIYDGHLPFDTKYKGGA